MPGARARPPPAGYRQPDRFEALDTAFFERETSRIRFQAGPVACPHALEEGGVQRLETVRLPGCPQPLGRHLRGQVEQQGQIGLAARLNPRLQRAQHRQIESPAAALIGKGGVGEAVAQHPRTAGQRWLDHGAQMVAPPGKHEQRFGQRIHGFVQEEPPQPLGQRRATGFPGAHHLSSRLAPGVLQGVQMGGLARTVDAFERDEAAGNGHGLFLRWYWFTARLCSASVALNALLPSPRATKYSALVGAGCTAAINAALPGMAIGVGGRPRRV